MKNKKLLPLILAILILLVGCKTNKNNKETLDESKKETLNTQSGKSTQSGTSETNLETNSEIKSEVSDETNFKYIENGGFYLNNKGVAIPKEETKGKKIVEWYTEPICPYCVTLGDEVKPHLEKIQGENTLIQYFPLTFLGKTDDKNDVTFSDVITGIWLSMAENDPELVGKYYKLTSSDKFLQEIQKSTNQNKFLEEAYTKELGGKNWDKIANELPKYMKISKATTDRIRQDKELASKTPKGRITTPTIYIRGAEKTENLKDIKDFKAKFKEILK